MTGARRKRAELRFVRLSAVMVTLMILFGVALKVLSVEHDKRMVVLHHGPSVPARVTSSQRNLKSCSFSYEFVVNGKSYRGGEGGCPLVNRYSAGDIISIHYDAHDPRRSVAPGAGVWPRWTFLAILGLGVTLSAYILLGYGIWWEDVRVRRRRI